jgi:hypothetical protein
MGIIIDYPLELKYNMSNIKIGEATFNPVDIIKVIEENTGKKLYSKRDQRPTKNKINTTYLIRVIKPTTKTEDLILILNKGKKCYISPIKYDTYKPLKISINCSICNKVIDTFTNQSDYLLGICIDCKKEIERDRNTERQQYLSEYGKKYRKDKLEKNIKFGLCIKCGRKINWKISTSDKFCEVCDMDIKRQSRKKIEKCKKNKLCRSCKKPLDCESETLCGSCLSYRKDYDFRRWNGGLNPHNLKENVQTNKNRLGIKIIGDTKNENIKMETTKRDN